MPSRRATSATARGPPACCSSRTDDGVERLRQRLLQRDLAAVAVLEVRRAPVADADRRVQHECRPAASRARAPPSQTNGLNAEPGLPARRDGPVERARAVVAAADHGAHRPGRGVQHDRPRPGPRRRPRRARPASPPAALRRPPAARLSSVVRTTASASGGSTALAPAPPPSRRTSPAVAGSRREGDLAAAACASCLGDRAGLRPSRPAPRARARPRRPGRRAD